MPTGTYGSVDYRLDRRLIRAFNALQDEHQYDPTAPWESGARRLLARKQERVRTGPGHTTSGNEASFSPVFSGDVTDAQAYVVLMKEVNAAEARTQEFRARYASAGRVSPLEDLANAIEIAKIDGAKRRANDLTYVLGQRLLALPPGEQRKVKKRIGYELCADAIGSVQPSLV